MNLRENSLSDKVNIFLIFQWKGQIEDIYYVASIHRLFLKEKKFKL